jgi:hypothetical protein
MRLAGFTFKKISAEKISDSRENLKVNTNIDISNIESLKTDFIKAKEELLLIKFNYILDYAPEIAKIEFKGDLILAVSSEKAKEILKDWKDKKIKESFNLSLFNLILRKSNIRALQLEEEINLPIHFQLPSLKSQKPKEEPKTE